MKFLKLKTNNPRVRIYFQAFPNKIVINNIHKIQVSKELICKIIKVIKKELKETENNNSKYIEDKIERRL